MDGRPLDRSEHHLLLRLYRGSTEVPFTRFQDWSLDLLGTLIRFDAAWWGKANTEPARILHVHLRNAEASIVDDYRGVDRHDFFRDAMMAAPGTAINFSDLVTRRDYEKSPLYRRYGRKHRVEAALGTVIAEPVSSMTEFLTLWRFDARWPFSDTDRALYERLAPHLFEANRISRLVSLQGPMASAGAGEAAHPWALASPDDGVLLEVNASFVGLAKREWPSWRGSIVPDPLRRLLADCRTYRGRHVVIDIRDVDGFRLLVAHAAPTRDRLGARESEVLALYAAGHSYREIAERQFRSPATVRNQLAQIYRKLNVHSKVELLRALRLEVPGPRGGTPDRPENTGAAEADPGLAGLRKGAVAAATLDPASGAGSAPTSAIRTHRDRADS